MHILPTSTRDPRPRSTASLWSVKRLLEKQQAGERGRRWRNLCGRCGGSCVVLLPRSAKGGEGRGYPRSLHRQSMEATFQERGRSGHFGDGE